MIFRPWDKSKLLVILGTKHIIYQKKGNLMWILKIDVSSHLLVMERHNWHSFTGIIFLLSAKYSTYNIIFTDIYHFLIMLQLILLCRSYSCTFLQIFRLPSNDLQKDPYIIRYMKHNLTLPYIFTQNMLWDEILTLLRRSHIVAFAKYVGKFSNSLVMDVEKNI